MPARQGGLSVWKDTGFVGLHDGSSPKIDVYIARRDQSVDVVAAGNTLGVAEEIAEPQTRRCRNLGFDDFTDFERHAASIEAPVIFQILDIPLQRPIDLSR